MTKPTTPNSPSTTEPNELKQKRPWLQKHYEEKRQRTISLVQAAVDQLVREQQMVTIEAICRKSVEVDAEGRGVKKSAILENAEAHAYYRKHSTTYQTAKNRNRKARHAGRTRGGAQPLRIDPNRDVDRLLGVEQAYAELQQQCAQLQFQVLEQELRKIEEQKQAHGQPKRKGGKTTKHDEGGLRS